MASEGYAHPEFLVETEWLESHLGDGDLRILDCTVFLHPLPGGDMRAESGRTAYEQGHIPGAVFADLIDDLSDPDSRLRFTLPSASRFAEAMSRYGVGEGTRVVLYSTNTPHWAARVWWMLRKFGFDDAAVLNGGWKKWTMEGRSTSTEPGSYPPARFVARPRPGLFVDKDAVRQSMTDGDKIIVNALTLEQHRGTGGNDYGRAGHIPGSVCVPTRSLLNTETDCFRPAPELRALFADAGVTGERPVITYCGGGIAASGDALALALIGIEDIAVYDASLQEWAKDESLPMETG